MKAYVSGYDSRDKLPKEEQEKFRPSETHVVQFHAEPKWKMDEYEAKSQCAYLNNMRVRVLAHVCMFTVEELSDGQFVVVCLNHPDQSE